MFLLSLLARYCPDSCSSPCFNFSVLFSSIVRNTLTLVRPMQGSHSVKMSKLCEGQPQDLRSFSPTSRLHEIYTSHIIV